MKKSLLKSNNVSSPAKSVKIIEPNEYDEKAKLDETFSLGKDDNDLDTKTGNQNASIQKSVLFSTKRQVCSQSVFKRLSMSLPSSKSNFKTMAELLKDFEKKTRIYSPPVNKPKVNWKVTRPIAPKLTAISRNRVAPLSSLDQEVENMKSYHFKATPFNRKLFDSKFHSGMNRVYPKPITKPINPVFRSDLRIKSRRSTLHGPN